ncbi:hypothetical protein DS901_14475 [Loktanella sp. D2R18]|nr:hypothetical protein DS901_14475 [Loktanella sp. D2R18]
MVHPYEIVIPDTQFGEMVICQLYDSDDLVVASEHDNTGNGETRLFFTYKLPVTSARCFEIIVPLWIDS